MAVNLRHSPDPDQVETRATPPSSIHAQLGAAPEAEELLSILAINFAAQRKLFKEAGFSSIRSLWLRHAANLGGTVTARTMRDEITGTFEDLDKEGNLILRTAGGPVAVTAADIFF